MNSLEHNEKALLKEILKHGKKGETIQLSLRSVSPTFLLYGEKKKPSLHSKLTIAKRLVKKGLIEWDRSNQFKPTIKVC